MSNNLEENLINNFILPDDPKVFLELIMAHYPSSDRHTLRKVISLGQVKYLDTFLGEKVTACVLNTKPYSLVFGKKFCQTWISKIEDAVYLLSHELHHLILDHFADDIIKEFRDDVKLANDAIGIILDCQVNATCHNSFKSESEAYIDFPRRYYPQTEIPYCFYRSDGIPTDPNLPPGMEEDLRNLHKKLYSSEGISNKDLIRGLMPWFELNREGLKEFLKNLLGNHRDTLKDRVAHAADENLESVAQHITHDFLTKNDKEELQDLLNNKENKNNGAGSGHEPLELLIKTFDDWLTYLSTIRKKINKQQVVSPSAKIARALSTYCPTYPTRTVIPNFRDQRTVAFHSLKKRQIFHKSPVYGSKTITPCYLDVSGSQSSVIPYMIPVVSKLRKKIGDVVYCFSNYVSDTRINALRTGKYRSSGGTDFDPIAEHIIANNFKQAVIFTDGDAPSISISNLKELKKRNVKITVGWTVSNPQKSSLAPIIDKEFTIFTK